MTGTLPGPEALLTPAEVAALFGVTARTVHLWAVAGCLAPVKTARGHRRFREPEVRALLRGDKAEGGLL